MSADIQEHFQPAYRYVVRSGIPESGEILDQSLWERYGVVYARFCLDDPSPGYPVYIGSAKSTLRQRIKAHLRLYKLGRSADYWRWAEGRQITILAYRPDPIELLGRVIPIHCALEEALIEEFTPDHAGSRPWFTKRA